MLGQDQLHYNQLARESNLKMGKSKQNHQERVLLDLLNSPVNRNKCGECKAHDPTWASWNLGVFLCGRCASGHRSLGRHISRVKSLSMENWSKHELDVLGRIGNKRNNQFWNEKSIPFTFEADDKDELVMWLRRKYTGKFRYGPVTDKDYNLDDDWGDRTDDYGFDKIKTSKRGYFTSLSSDNIGPTRSMRRAQERSMSYDGEDYGYDDDYPSRNRRGSARSSASPVHTSSSSSVGRSMRLTYRRPTDTEYRKYGDMSRKMKYDLGYEDEDSNIEALSMTHGNIPKAVEILKQNGSKPSNANNSRSSVSSYSNRVEPNRTPSLPARKQETGAIFDSSKAGGFNWLDDTVSTSVTTMDTGNAADNNIYQYVDPTTGNVYYIDAQGQQYIDPSQQQQMQQFDNTMIPQQQIQQPMAPQQTVNPFQQPVMGGVLPLQGQPDLTLNQLQLQQLQQQQQQQIQMQIQMQQTHQLQQQQQQQPFFNGY